MNGRRALVSAALMAAFVSILAAGVVEARSQDTPQAPIKPALEKAPGQALAAAPGNIKERASVYVLLAWLWLSLAVLLRLLRLKVREADRVFHMGLDRASEKTVQDP
jgi:hypothetical protein